jgi:hypothetical protein
MSNYGPNPAKQGQPSQHAKEASEIEPQDRGQAAVVSEQEDVNRYMADLGAGTGVDIGPGAAGEMGGAAQESEEEEDLIYPDSGDFPHLLPGHHDAP